VHFTNKAGAPLLQMADAVAFAVRHYLSGHRDGLWAMQHLTGFHDVEPLFASGKGQAGGSAALDWSRLSFLDSLPGWTVGATF
jgi:hypothetical protein